MSRFTYEALDAGGDPVGGNIEAESLEAARAQIASVGHEITSIRQLAVDLGDPAGDIGVACLAETQCDEAASQARQQGCDPAGGEDPDEGSAAESVAGEIPGVASDCDEGDEEFNQAATIPPEQLQAALRIGMEVMQAVSHGCMVMLYPSLAQGGGHVSLGRVLLPLSGLHDVNRMLNVARAIDGANRKAAQVSQSTADPIAQAQMISESEKFKDNVVSNQAAQAEGRNGGIIIP